MARDPGKTRALLLDTAERLMAVHGPDAVSMREISKRAGQRNNNAAQYHFDSTEGIIEAVLDRRMTPIDRRRAEMIAALPPDPSIDALVRAVVIPLAEASRRHPHYVGFLAQLRLSRRYGHLVTDDRPRTTSFLDVRDQIDAGLHELAAEEKSRRRGLCATLIVHAIAETVAAPDAETPARRADLVEGLVAACVRVLASP